MKNLNNKQRKALDYLVLDLDELSNKPRRLFSSLVGFVEAFIEKGKRQSEIIADINEWEDFYYASIRQARVLEEIGRACLITKKEMREEYIEYHKDNMKELNSHMYTVSQVIKKMAKQLTSSVIDDIY